MKHLVLYIIFLLTAFCSKASAHWSIAGSDGKLWQNGKLVTDIEGNIILNCNDVYYNCYYTNWALVCMKRVVETDVVRGRTIAVHDTYGAIDLLGNVIVDFKYKNPKRVYADKAWKNRCKDAQLGTKYADIIRRAESAMEKHAVRAMVYKIGAARAASVDFNRDTGILCTSCKYVNEWLYAGRIGGSYGVIDSWNNVVVDFGYDDIATYCSDKWRQDRDYSENRFIAVKKKGGKNYDVLDYCGNVVWSDWAKEIEDDLQMGMYIYVSPTDNKHHITKYDPHVKVVDFIKHYVSLNMKYWMRKNETETSADYAARLSEQNNAYAQEVYAELAVDTYRKLYPEEKLFIIGDYDLDDKSFLVKTDFGSVAMNVPESEFIKFKTRWNDGSVVLADGKNMKTMQKLTPLSFHHTEAGLTLHRLDVIDNVAVNSYIANSYIPYRGADYTDVAALPDVDIALVGDGEGKDKGKGGGEIYTAPSDVDTNIPYGSIARAAKTFVVIVDNENYRQLAKVPFALNDGRIFAEYCTRTFGIPADNVMRYDNATYGMMLEALTRLGNIAKAYGGDIDVIFYYSGHGAPSEADRKAYLVPVDAYTVQPQGCCSLEHLYAQLGSMGARKVLCLIDACFSGNAKSDGNELLSSVRGLGIETQDDVPSGNTVVMTASHGEQTAMPFREKRHGMFTYFMLKKLQLTGGRVTLGELFDYVEAEVRKASAVKANRMQTPTVTVSGDMPDGWRDTAF